jgi:hypothetical protein
MAIIATVVDGEIVSMQTHCSSAQAKSKSQAIVPVHLADKLPYELKLVDGQVVEKTQKEKDQIVLTRRLAAVRSARDFQLQHTDFEALKAFEGVPSNDWPQIKKDRQLLRDIPQVYANDIAAAEAALGIGGV